MRFDPQSNYVPQDGDAPASPASRPGPVHSSMLARFGAGLVIVAFGGATLVATVLWTPARTKSVVVVTPSQARRASPEPTTGPPGAEPGLAESGPDRDEPPPRPSAGDRGESLIAYQTGRAFASTGQLDAAVAPLTEAIELDPTFAGAHYALGLVQVRRGDLVAAHESALELEALDPSLASLLGNLISERAMQPTPPSATKRPSRSNERR